MKHTQIALCCLCCCALAGSIGSIPFPADTAVCAEAEAGVSLAEAVLQPGQPIHAVLSGIASDGVTYAWTVGGIAVQENGSSYTPTAEDYEKMISVTVTADGTDYTASVYFSRLPVVYIDTAEEITSKTEYIGGSLRIQGNAEFSSASQLYSGAVQIRGRGNYTWEHDKKPYKIKLDTKTDVLGMGLNKHWVLLAEYLDPTHLRNEIMPQLSHTLGFDYTADSEAVAVVLNGEYNGLYHLGENVRVDENRVNIYDWEETAEDLAKAVYKKEKSSGMTKDDRDALEVQLTEDLMWISTGTFIWNEKDYTVSDYVTLPEGIDGGYLLELDTYDEYHVKQVSDFETAGAQPIQFKSPEYAVTNPEMYQYAKDWIQQFEDAVSSDDFYSGGRHYTELFDMQSLVQYWLMLELSSNCDGMRYSNFMYKDFGQIFKMGPAWDYDWTWNASYVVPTDEWWTDQTYYNQTAHWYKYLVQDPYFLAQAYALYQAHRDEFAQVYADGGLFDRTAEALRLPAEADLAKWHEKQDYDTELAKTKTYVTERFQWLDQQFADIGTLAQSLGLEQSEKLAVTDITASAQGVTMTASVSDSAAASVSFYVNGLLAGEAPVKNGSAALTVSRSLLDADADAYNTVQIRMKDASGSFLAAEPEPETQNPWGHGWNPWGEPEAPDVRSLVYSAFDAFTAAELGLRAAVPGDVDANGRFDSADAVMLCRYLLSDGTLTDWRAGDFDANGRINAADFTLMKRALLS